MAIKEPKDKNEGGKSFKRLDNDVPLFLCVYINDTKEILLVSDENSPMAITQVTDTNHKSFAATTYEEMLAEIDKRKLIHPY